MRARLGAFFWTAVAAFAGCAGSAQSTIQVPAAQPTIQAGINAAANGDTVLVAPGTYLENLDFKGKAITLISSAGAAQTIIDGRGKGPVVQFLSHEPRTSIVNGFTLQHGGGAGGLTGGSNGQFTAGVLIQNAAPTLLNNVITQNNCYGIYSATGSPLIQSNKITGTSPVAGNSCDAVAIGAGIVIDGALGEQPELLGGSNPAGPLTPTLFPTITGNEIANNNDSEDASSSGGGGIHVLFGYTIIQGNYIHNNFSQQTGGGIAVSDYNYTYYDTVAITQNIIINNTSACGGAGIAFNQSTVAGIGSPFYFVVNNTIADNIVAGTCADGITANSSQVYLWQDSDRFVFVNNVVFGASATQAAVFCEPLRPQSGGFHLAIFDHNDVYNPSGPAFDGRCTNPTGSYGNLSGDPLFVSRSTGNYHLSAGSPAIDSGNNSAPFLASVDYDANPRTSDATSLGYPVIDMGAYEFTGQLDASTTAITLTPSAYQINNGQSVTLSLAVISSKGIPTGSVSLFEDGASIATLALSATATASFVVPPPTPGVHTFLATYGAQAGYPAGVSVKVYVVVGTTTTTLSLVSSLNPAVAGQPVTLTVNAQASDGSVPTPVTLSDGGTALAQLNPSASGQATYTTSTLAAGSHLLSAAYAGDATHPSAAASLTQIITSVAQPDTLTLLCPATPVLPYQALHLTAQVTASTGTPSGSVAVTINNLPYASITLASGTGTATGAGLASGTFQINAAYTPANNYQPSSASCVVTVAPGPTVVSLSASPATFNLGQSTTLSVAVSSSAGTILAGDSVTFTSSSTGSTVLGTLALSPGGTGTYLLSNLPPGLQSVTASFGGDASFAASASSVAVNVVAATSATTLTASPQQTTPFGAVLLTASVTGPNGVPGGSIVFTSNGSRLGAATLNQSGTATLTFTGLALGTDTLVASYSGSASYNSSVSGPFVETVSAVATTMTLNAVPSPVYQGQSLLLSAAVSSPGVPANPGGAVLFTDITASQPVTLGAITLSANSSASLQLATLAPGTHLLRAAYQPTAGAPFSASQVTLSVVVLPSDFNILPAASTLSVRTEYHAPLAYTLNSVGAFSGPVTLSCSNLPVTATCTFSATAVNLSAGTTISGNVIVDTDAVFRFKSLNDPPGMFTRLRPGFALATLVPLASLLLLRRRRRLVSMLSMLLLAMLGAVTGCSGKYPAHTPPGTYQIQVMASSGSLVHTANISLNITE